MNKDVIYIDVDDDVTAIIGKIKKSTEKIVAIVPPKRAGALQSAVNMRLLERMARADKKKLVLITHNPALMALAANAKIPVAKNLQSKPEMAEIPAIIVDDGDDIIDGADLPIGDHAETVKSGNNGASTARSQAIESTNLDIDDSNSAKLTDKGAARPVVANSKNRVKVPDFDTFRKKIILGFVGGVALASLLVWMFVFAPAATVIITARTQPQPVSSSVRLGGQEATSFEKGVISSVTQTEKRDITVDFDATGIGLVGEKASGSVVFRNCEEPSTVSIPAGTVISTGGKSYTTQAAVSVPAGSGGFFGCSAPGVSSAVDVVANEVGADRNVPSGTVFSVAGHPNTATVYMRAVASTAIDGGSSREVKVVSAEDIERARGQLIGQSTNDDKKALVEKFTNREVVVGSSFLVERGDSVSVPAVNEEATDGKAKLTVSATFTIQAVPRAELEKYLKASIESSIDTELQKIYNSGIDKATLSSFRNDEGVMLATLNASGDIGPKINEDSIKEQVRGKRYGEVQQRLEALDGIQEVDVQFSYFWVRTIPNNINKIGIEFKVQDE